MSDPGSWRRRLSEGVVIVVSILLAFGIQAWWDGHQERQREEQYLGSLLRELSANRDRIRVADSVHAVKIAAFEEFYEAKPAVLAALSPESAEAFSERLNGVLTISLREEVVSRDEIALIRDVTLRDAIGEWTALAGDVREDLPGMVQRAGDTNGRMTELSPEIRIEGTLDGSPARALEALRDDALFMRYRVSQDFALRINHRKLGVLMEQTDLLIEMLGGAAR